MTSTETRSDVFSSTRPLLFAIAYRMLGSVTDAEDLVQDAYLRWQDAAGNEIREPRAYLTTIVTRLALNHLRSAHGWARNDVLMQDAATGASGCARTSTRPRDGSSSSIRRIRSSVTGAP